MLQGEHISVITFKERKDNSWAPRSIHVKRTHRLGEILREMRSSEKHGLIKDVKHVS